MSSNRRPTKNEKRRCKKKLGDDQKITETNSNKNGIIKEKNGSYDDDYSGVDIEYVSADFDRDSSFNENMMAEFKSIFEKFATPEDLTNIALSSTEATDKGIAESKENDRLNNGGALVATDSEPVISKKKKKLSSRLSVAELKQLVTRPDVVEAHDVTSHDPRLLVFLKGYRNTVPVPRHWCHKRKYLQGKRGVEKPPFKLPEFIADTGISKIRASVIEQEALKKSKQKARDRMQPRMGKIDIDYQVLHDAFFKYQTKPKLVGHGDLYYEGKENEVKLVKSIFSFSLTFIGYNY